MRLVPAIFPFEKGRCCINQNMHSPLSHNAFLWERGECIYFDLRNNAFSKGGSLNYLGVGTPLAGGGTTGPLARALTATTPR
jgi:hypothetical protein